MRRRKDKVFIERRKQRNKKQYMLPLAYAGGFLVVAFILYMLIFGFGPAAENFYSLNVTAQTNVKANDENIYYLSGSTLNCADKTGKEVWKVKFTSGAADLSVGENSVCVYSSDIATVMTAGGEHMYTIPTTDIKTIGVSCGSNYTAFLGKTDDAQYLRVFDNQGQEIYRGQYDLSGILDYGFYSDNDMLYTLTLDTSGISPVSRVTTLSPATKTLTGTVDVIDQLISDIEFIDADMLLCGTSTIGIYDSFGKQMDPTSIYGLTYSDSAITENGYVYAFIPRDISELTTSCTARIISKSGDNETDTNIQLPSGVMGVYVSSGKLYCVLSDSLYIYKLSGEFEKSIDAPDKITGVEKLGEGKLKISCKDEVYLMLMKR